MKALRRLFTVLLGVILLAVGALLILCVNNSGIRNFWMNNIDYIVNNFWVGTIAAIVLILLGVIAVVIGVHVKKVDPYTKVTMGEFGQVDISLSAIDAVVGKV
ncbi:MAG: hypothetical protein IJP33_03935, partial [Firmicutes bacterium]|nr:hypothetical protein [Bacillota bacterium]